MFMVTLFSPLPLLLRAKAALTRASSVANDFAQSLAHIGASTPAMARSLRRARLCFAYGVARVTLPFLERIGVVAL